MPYDYTPRHLAYVLHALIELPPPAEHDAQAQVRNENLFAVAAGGHRFDRDGNRTRDLDELRVM